jgi:DNA-binding NtrC family response regulator
MKPLLLYVDDDQSNLDTFKRAFRFDYKIETALSAKAALEWLKNNPEIAVIVSDQRMPQMSGVEFLKEAMKISPYAERIMLTAFTDNEALIKAIQHGHVYDYVVKPWDKEDLKHVLDKAISLHQDRIEKIKKLKVAEIKISLLESETSFNFSEIIGSEGCLKPLIDQVKKAAPTSSTILIRGESGTGKELIAKAIHFNSTRREGPFVKVNCSALSPGILESELFGHEKGAFTGALSKKIGRFELANGGTLFLDEIGDLPELVQVKMLRVLQEREFERVGGTELVRTDIRLIAATHQNLEKRIEEGKFRQDLFFRLNVIPVFLPALRERGEDIPLLAKFFIQKFCSDMGKKLSINDEALAALKEYDWPGNVRELANVIERVVVLAEEDELTLVSLERNLVATNHTVKEAETFFKTSESKDFRHGLLEDEAQKLAENLKKFRGNISEAARVLELPRSTLVHRLKKCGLIP